jgi:sigma-B regulation protein RsbU (phosphoserine phosphatase)
VDRHRTPGDILRVVNRNLLKTNVSGMFVTLLYGQFDCLTGLFTYARAGHPPPVILDGAGAPLPVLTGIGHPLGLFDELKLDEAQITIPADGLALLYSDGITEATDPNEKFYGLPRLLHVLKDNLNATAPQICTILWENMSTYIASSPQQDDFTVVAVRGKRR